MLKIIEYLFYFIRKKYQKWGEGDSSGVYALCFISLIQFLNLTSLWLLLLIFKVIDAENVSKYYAVIAMVVLLFVDYYYIYKVRGTEYISDLYAVHDIDKKKVARSSLVYVILSFVSFMLLMAIYIKS
jgi:hypothetical protein